MALILPNPHQGRAVYRVLHLAMQSRQSISIDTCQVMMRSLGWCVHEVPGGHPSQTDWYVQIDRGPFTIFAYGDTRLEAWRNAAELIHAA